MKRQLLSKRTGACGTRSEAMTGRGIVIAAEIDSKYMLIGSLGIMYIMVLGSLQKGALLPDFSAARYAALPALPVSTMTSFSFH